MEHTQSNRVIDKEGILGTLVSPAHDYEDTSTVTIRLDSGDEVQVPGQMLERRSDGTFYLPVALSRLQTVVPVIEETASVGKRRVQTGGYRVTKKVHERTETVDEPGYTEEVEIERVAVNRVLDAPIAARQEGDTLIVPVLEEVLVVEKRLVLKEELHVTRRRRETRNPQTVVLRSEEVTVDPLEGVDRADTENTR